MSPFETTTVVIAAFAVLISALALWLSCCSNRIAKEANKIAEEANKLARATEKLAKLQFEEAHERRNRTQVTMALEPDSTKPGEYLFRMINEGAAPAKDVTFTIPPTSEWPPPLDYSQRLPIKLLCPGESELLPSHVQYGIPSKLEVSVSWTNPDGTPGNRTETLRTVA